jgi:hypothetical protein
LQTSPLIHPPFLPPLLLLCGLCVAPATAVPPLCLACASLYTVPRVASALGHRLSPPLWFPSRPPRGPAARPCPAGRCLPPPAIPCPCFLILLLKPVRKLPAYSPFSSALGFSSRFYFKQSCQPVECPSPRCSDLHIEP